MNNVINSLIGSSILLLVVGGLCVYPAIRAWRNNHKGWAWAIILTTPILLGVTLGFISLLMKKDKKWPLEKGFESLTKVSINYEPPPETTYDERVATRLKFGMVALLSETGHIFPPNCVICLKPATVFKDWEGSDTVSDFDFMKRQASSHTNIYKIVGIPYCDDCGKKAHFGSLFEWRTGLHIQYPREFREGYNAFREDGAVLYIKFSNKEYAQLFWDTNKFTLNSDKLSSQVVADSN